MVMVALHSSPPTPFPSLLNPTHSTRTPLFTPFLSRMALSQGFMVVLALLLVLWLPLLFFSSGAPTYQTPTLVDVKLEVSLGQVRGGGRWEGQEEGEERVHKT